MNELGRERDCFMNTSFECVYKMAGGWVTNMCKCTTLCLFYSPLTVSWKYNASTFSQTYIIHICDIYFFILCRALQVNVLICIHRSHFGDVHQIWAQVIFTGMSNILKAINPQGEWLNFVIRGWQHRSLGYPDSVRWQHFSAPQLCFLGVVTQPTDSRLKRYDQFVAFYCIAKSC